MVVRILRELWGDLKQLLWTCFTTHLQVTGCDLEDKVNLKVPSCPYDAEQREAWQEIVRFANIMENDRQRQLQVNRLYAVVFVVLWHLSQR